MSGVNPGRLAALRALIGVEGGAHAEDLLERLAPREDRDRRLAWALVMGVLRRQGALDSLLQPHLKQPLERLDAPVRVALRLGAYELRATRVPTHAAVSQAVEGCRRAGAPRAAGLVNAVLRKVGPGALPEDPFLDLPTWLQQRWSGWGEWVARLAEPAPVALALRSSTSGPEGVELEPVIMGDEEVQDLVFARKISGRLDELPGFAEGDWWVMDPSAALTADLCLRWWEGEAPRVLDACAAPGGKSLRLASRGAEVRCTDTSAERLALLGENAARVGFTLPARVHDWLDGTAEDLGSFDIVLVDAPCTGLGTVRRHPEIKWRRLPSDPAAMALRQRRILKHASTRVRDGGLLVYSVCSTEPEEGEGVVASLKGWKVVHRWSSTPPKGDEDGFQVFGLIATDTGPVT